MGKNTIILENDDETEIKYIYHLSDIHIRNSLRKTEYREVFDSLLKKIKTQVGKKNNENLVVVTGDIMHSNIHSQPSAYGLAKYFFKKLLEITSVIVIAGNHDCNIKNIDESDTLLVVLDETGDVDTTSKYITKDNDSTKLYYLRKTGFYQYYNIVFALTCMHDKIILKSDELDKKIFDKIKQDNKYKIALYHGTIDKSRVDSGYKLKSERFNAGDFEGYDYVLLGDVHKFQYMNEEKTIAYAGSLIQQSHGENIDGHGFLKWNLPEFKSKHYEIPNNHGFVTIRITDGKMEKTDIPENPYIRVILKNTSQSQFAIIKNDLLSKYSISDISIKGSTNNMLQVVTDYQLLDDVKKKVIGKDFLYTNKLTKFLQLMGKDKKEITSIVKIHEKISKQVSKNEKDKKSKQTYNNHNWNIIELNFSNMLAYGKNNIIDFTKYTAGNTIGIIAPNYYGKSSLVDIILYALFGKWSRGDGNEIINNDETTMHCSIKIKIGSKYYLIERKGIRSIQGDVQKHTINKINKTNTTKVKLFFYCITYDKKGNENIEDLTDNNKKHTQSKIEELIGDYNKYVKTCFSLQHQGQTNFLDASKEERKIFLQQLLNLSIFDSCKKISKNKKKELKVELACLDKQIHKYDITSIEKNILDLEKSFKKINKNVVKYESLLELFVKNDKPQLVVYDELSDYELSSIGEIEKNIVNLETNLNEIQNDELNNVIDIICSSNIRIEKIDKKINKLESSSKKCWSKIVNISSDITDKPDNGTDVYKEKKHIDKKIFLINESLSEFSETTIEKLTTKIDNIEKNNKNLEREIKYVDEKCESRFYDLQRELTVIKKKIANYYLLLINSHDELPNDCDELNRMFMFNTEYTKFIQFNVNELDKFVKNHEDNNVDDLIKLSELNTEQIRKNNLSNQKILNKINDLSKKNTDITILTSECKNMQIKLQALAVEINIYHNNIIINNNIDKNNVIISDLKNNLELMNTLDSFNEKLKIIKSDLKKINLFEKYDDNNNILRDKIKKNNNKIDKYDTEKSELLKSIKINKEEKKRLKQLVTDNENIEYHISLLKKYKSQFNKYQIKYSKFEKLSQEKKDIEEDLGKFQNEYDDIKRKLYDEKRKLKKYNSLSKKKDHIQSKFDLYSTYHSIIDCKSGLPCYIIKEYLNPLSQLVNHMLQLFVDFHIRFEYIENSSKKKNNSVAVFVCHKNDSVSTVESSSGFQKFIIGLSLRIAFSQLFVHAKPNFFVIDEGWGCMDHTNISNVGQVLKYIKELYDHVIIISHLDIMNKELDHSINIEKKKGYSFVNTFKT